MKIKAFQTKTTRIWNRPYEEFMATTTIVALLPPRSYSYFIGFKDEFFFKKKWKLEGSRGQNNFVFLNIQSDRSIWPTQMAASNIISIADITLTPVVIIPPHMPFLYYVSNKHLPSMDYMHVFLKLYLLTPSLFKSHDLYFKTTSTF